MDLHSYLVDLLAHPGPWTTRFQYELADHYVVEGLPLETFAGEPARDDAGWLQRARAIEAAAANRRHVLNTLDAWIRAASARHNRSNL